MTLLLYPRLRVGVRGGRGRWVPDEHAGISEVVVACAPVKRSQLQPNPERVRAWLQAARERPRAPRSSRLNRAPTHPFTLPDDIRRRVLARSGGMCVRPGCGRRAQDPHHVLAKQAGRFPELALAEIMIVGVCRQCHEEHEAGQRRLPRAALPPDTIAFAKQNGRYWYWVEKLYPA